MKVDYSSYQPGVALAREVILAVCPKCGQSGHVRELSKGVQVFHEVSLQWRKPADKAPSRRRDGTYNPLRVRARVVPQRQCRFTAKEWDELDVEQRAAANWRTFVCPETIA